MGSLRFPFPSFPPTYPPPSSRSDRQRLTVAGATVAAAAAAATAAGIAITKQNSNTQKTWLDFLLSPTLPSPSPSPSPFWASLSLSSNVNENNTVSTFPATDKDSKILLGVGTRKKTILGMKNINVYEFGVYVSEEAVQTHLQPKYPEVSASELKDDPGVTEALLTSDVPVTVRLQIVYSRLSIRAVRSAFEESVGKRIKKFGEEEEKQLLKR